MAVLTLPLLLLALSAPGSCGKPGKKHHSKLQQISCAVRNRLIGIAEHDRVVTVERLPGSQIVLTCNYCGEGDDGGAKQWYKTNDLWNIDVAGKPVKAGTKTRITVKVDHSLVINQLDVNDTGMYYCYDRYHADSQHKYIYTVDMLFPAQTPPIEGSTPAELQHYTDKYINKTTKYKLKTYWRFEDIELYLSWAPWSQCHGCKGQPGQMWRMGTLRERHHDFQQQKAVNSRGQMSVSYKTGLAARSMHIFMHEKQLSLALRELPDYLQRRNCTNPRRCKSKKRASDSLRERSFLAKLGPAPRKRFSAEVYESDPAILECPWPPEQTIRRKLRRIASETTAGKLLGIHMERPKDRDITWYYYNRVVNKSVFDTSAHRMRVSRDGRLMIAAVRRDDRGRYSCAEDGIQIAVIQLKIKPTYNLRQSYTALRVLGVSFVLDLGIFVFFMVVLWRQRRVQRLLAGARWRHEQRQELRRKKGRKKRFLLQQRRQLEGEKERLAASGVDTDEVMHLLGETLFKDEDDDEDGDNEAEEGDAMDDVEGNAEEDDEDEDYDDEGDEGDDEEGDEDEEYA